MFYFFGLSLLPYTTVMETKIQLSSRTICVWLNNILLPLAGQLAMGGSSSKESTFFWQKEKKKKKKESPLNKAWSQLSGAVPNKRKKKKSIVSLDILNTDNLKKGKRSRWKKRLSLTADKKEPISLRKLSLGNTRKLSGPSLSLGKKEKDGGGLGKVGEQIKRKLSRSQEKDQHLAR